MVVLASAGLIGVDSAKKRSRQVSKSLMEEAANRLTVLEVPKEYEDDEKPSECDESALKKKSVHSNSPPLSDAISETFPRPPQFLSRP